MSRTSKGISLLIAILIAIIVIIGVVLYFNAAIIVSHLATRSLGVKTTVERVIFHKGEIEIRGVKVRNPKRSSLPYALTIATNTIRAPYKNYFKNHIDIDAIEITSPNITVETYNSANTSANWTKLMASVSQDRPTPDHKNEGSGSGRSATIKELLITNIGITLKLYGQDPQVLKPIPKIAFSNINTEQGFPFQEILEIILQHMLNQVFSLKNISKALLDVPETTTKKTLQNAGKRIEQLFRSNKGESNQ